MRSQKLQFVACALLAIPFAPNSCGLYSIHPAIDPAAPYRDERLLGRWEIADPNDPLNFVVEKSPDHDFAVRITWRSKGEVRVADQAFTAHIGEFDYLSVPVEDERTKATAFEIYRYRFVGEHGLELSIMDFEDDAARTLRKGGKVAFAELKFSRYEDDLDVKLGDELQGALGKEHLREDFIRVDALNVESAELVKLLKQIAPVSKPGIKRSKSRVKDSYFIELERVREAN